MNFPSDSIDHWFCMSRSGRWDGKTATDEMAQEVHADIRKVLSEMFGEAAASTTNSGGSMS